MSLMGYCMLVIYRLEWLVARKSENGDDPDDWVIIYNTIGSGDMIAKVQFNDTKI